MSVIKLADSQRRGDSSAALYLRELADRVERGDVTEFVIAGNDISERCYETFGIWDDRWRILGALENARSKVILDD